MGEAVDQRLMTVSELTLSEIEYEPLEAAHVEIIDELYDAHGVQVVSNGDSGVLGRSPVKARQAPPESNGVILPFSD